MNIQVTGSILGRAVWSASLLRSLLLVWQQHTAQCCLSASPLASQGSGGENLPEGKCPISYTPLSYLQSPSTEANISNPCYPQGYSTAFTLGHVFGSLCTEKQRPESYNSSKSVTFMGTGDPRLCREKVASVFDFNACQEQDACSFDGIYQPKVQGPFVVRGQLACVCVCVCVYL